jgi:hypothetical protein
MRGASRLMSWKAAAACRFDHDLDGVGAAEE